MAEPEEIEEDFIMRAQKEVEQMTPDKGFNLCGLDDFGDPTEQGLYLVNNFATEEEANAEMAKLQEKDPEERFYVYGAPAKAAPSAAKAFMAGQTEE